MLQKNLVYITLWLLLLVEINCQMTPFKPKTRHSHTATLIDNKLYILGGSYVGTVFVEVGKDFFYLDVSVPFNTENLSWKDLSSINPIPSHYSAASVKGGAIKNTLFLYGGISTNSTMALVYTLNNLWDIPKITGNIPISRKYDLTGIIDHNGKMYLWGGGTYTLGLANDMSILDTINLSWGKGSLVGAPPPRSKYGAILLPNSNIIYMGGNGAIEPGFSQIYIYDTINDNWSMKSTSGDVPSHRLGFSAILGLDGQRVIIFGGVYVSGVVFSPVKVLLYELDLTNYVWHIPNSSGQIPQVSRSDHGANVIGKYMVISFGSHYNQSIESDILLLDISNINEYIWTNEFYPSTPSPTPTPSSHSGDPFSAQQSNKMAMVGVVIGSLFGGALLSFGSSFLYKWNKNRIKQKDTTPIPGSENNIYNHGHEIVVQSPAKVMAV